MMKVLKWEIEENDVYVDKHKGMKKDELTQNLLNNGWEPFAVNNGVILFRRPVGYIEVEEKEINQEQKTVITKEVNFNLDSLRSK